MKKATDIHILLNLRGTNQNIKQEKISKLKLKVICYTKSRKRKVKNTKIK